MPILDNDQSETLRNRVLEAIDKKQPLSIVGGNSKHFYGFHVDAAELSISEHTGVISYEPTELCITVRAGTKLKNINQLLKENKQILPFEPPMYGENSTIGGVVAAGISGPRRPYSGSVRDAILGVKIINGEGEIVSFGGQVMKNVAGYDLSRLMVRSQGTLGLILEVSLRLLPMPEKEITLEIPAQQDYALNFFKEIRTLQYPVTASAWFNDSIYLRLSGSSRTLETTTNKLGTPNIMENNAIWDEIRDHKHHFFGRTDKPLWRLSLAPASTQIARIDDNQLIEWGGAQRWVNSNAPTNIIQNIAESRDGYATLFRGKEISETPNFPPLKNELMKIHQQIKLKMDPHHIFNPGRIYSQL